MDPDEREARWAQWMQQGLVGDEPAYRALLGELAVSLRATTRRRLQRLGMGEAEVEDVVQETLLAIHLKRHTWRSNDPLAPWVAAIGRNKLVDVLRRRGRRVELPLDEVAEPITEEAESEGAGHDVARLLAELAERPRRIVQLVSIEGRSAREAADELGMSEVALRVALHRALKGLARQLRAIRT